MSGDADSVNEHPFAMWRERPTLEITPSTTDFTPARVVDCLTQWHSLLAIDEVLEWRIVVENGECRYTISGTERTLSQLESTLRRALPKYTMTRRDDLPLPEIDDESLSGVRYEGHGSRRGDWQTGLLPISSDERRHSTTRSALTAAVDALAETEATVVYQALITPRADWGYIADDRVWQLEENRDTRAMRASQFLFPPDPEKEIEPYKSHEERIDLIRAADTRRSFLVAARAVAWRPTARRTLEQFSSPLTTVNGKFYTIEPVFVRDPWELLEEMAAQTVPTLSRGSKLGRWAVGASVKPTLTMDGRTLAHSCLVEGAALTDAGKRLLGTTPDDRTRLGVPEPEILAQYDEGFTIGQLQGQDVDSRVPNIVAVPPLMQRMHMIVIGKSGSGKSSLLVRGALDNHVATDGLSILIDGKGDGLPREYMQAHYSKYGTLDDVIHFDCSTVVPALSFFDVRPYLEDGNARMTAIEDIADHYIELVRAMMGPAGFDQAIVSPAVIRYLVKALFDPVHGSDAFSHRDLQQAATRMKATGDAPPVIDEELEEMLGGITSNTRKTFENVMAGVEARINDIPGDNRLKQLFDHVPGEDDPHFDFYDLLNEDVIVIFDTSSLRSNAQKAMTLVLLSNLWAALKRRAKNQHESERQLVNLYLEEAADVAASELVNDLLSQGRGFDLSMTLSMQFPKQLEEENQRAYSEALNNVSTVVSGNVSVDKDLATRFATADMSPAAAGNRLRALKRGEWLVSLPSAFGTPEPRPFTLDSTPLPDGHPGSDRPLTPAMRTAFDAKAQLVDDDTREQYAIDVTTACHASEATSDGLTTTDQQHILEYTKRLPRGIECTPASNAITCAHCDARYEISREGLLRAVECCYGLDRIDRDDVPLCSLSLTLTAEERAASGYTAEQLFFLQAVYDAHQQRFDREWEYDIVSDSMVRLQEYTGIEPAAVTDLLDDGLLAHDCDYPHKLYTVTAEGRDVLKEAHKRGVAHGDGRGDLGESSLHVAMVEVGRRYLFQAFVDDPDSPVTDVRTYYEVGDGTRLDAVGLDEDGTIVVAFEAERVNHDVLEAAPSDFDKIAACEPTHAIWLTENRDAAHTILQTLNDPKQGPPRIEETYSDSSQPQRLAIDTPGMTRIYAFRYVRDTLLGAT